jgi:hypothetical protein
MGHKEITLTIIGTFSHFLVGKVLGVSPSEVKLANDGRVSKTLN